MYGFRLGFGLTNKRSSSAASPDAVLLEDGTNLLLEDGSNLLLE